MSASAAAPPSQYALQHRVKITTSDYNYDWFSNALFTRSSPHQHFFSLIRSHVSRTTRTLSKQKDYDLFTHLMMIIFKRALSGFSHFDLDWHEIFIGEQWQYNHKCEFIWIDILFEWNPTTVVITFFFLSLFMDMSVNCFTRKYNDCVSSCQPAIYHCCSV